MTPSIATGIAGTGLFRGPSAVAAVRAGQVRGAATGLAASKAAHPAPLTWAQAGGQAVQPAMRIPLGKRPAQPVSAA